MGFCISAADAEPSRFAAFVSQFDIIAGDFIQVWKHLPADLTGKIIVTNTTTEKNVAELQKRGLHILVTNTPRLGGRSFGTNVMEAMCRCLVDKPDERINSQDFLDLIQRIPLKPGPRAGANIDSYWVLLVKNDHGNQGDTHQDQQRPELGGHIEPD
jgi:hypothetical protein